MVRRKFPAPSPDADYRQPRTGNTAGIRANANHVALRRKVDKKAAKTQEQKEPPSQGISLDIARANNAEDVRHVEHLSEEHCQPANHFDDHARTPHLSILGPA